MTFTAIPRPTLNLRLVALGLVTLALTLGGAAAQSPKIGIVDLNKLMDGWASVKKFEAEMKARVDAVNEEINALSKEVEALTKEIEESTDFYDEDAPEIQSLKTRRRQKAARLMATNDFNLVSLQRRMHEKTLEFYQRALEKVREYGKRHGYDLILKASTDAIKTDDPTYLELDIRMRTVIHFDDARLDITASVLEELNK